MLHFPCVVDAEPIRDLDLLERVVEQLLFRALCPRTRQLVFVKDAELHSILRCLKLRVAKV